MTRINLVLPSLLAPRQLVAEYRELPRVFGYVRTAQARGLRPSDIDRPCEYTLGKGHVKFFYPLCGFLVRRQASLIAEMLRRGYNPTHQDPSALTDGLHQHWLGDFTPSRREMGRSVQRLIERKGLL